MQNIETSRYGNAHGRYLTMNGTSFDARTDPKVIRALENARESRQRVRLFYGDVTTGRAWEEEHDVIGYIGRSMGPVKAPILVYNARSTGGGEILCHCVVAIHSKAGWIYRHPKFDPGVWSVQGTDVYHNGELYAREKTALRAKRLADFMSGKRLTKL